MATISVIVCDRCGSECREKGSSRHILFGMRFEGSDRLQEEADFCLPCFAKVLKELAPLFRSKGNQDWLAAKRKSVVPA